MHLDAGRRLVVVSEVPGETVCFSERPDCGPPSAAQRQLLQVVFAGVKSHTPVCAARWFMGGSGAWVNIVSPNLQQLIFHGFPDSGHLILIVPQFDTRPQRKRAPLSDEIDRRLT